MNNMLDYIEEYGDFSFKEKAFNEVDTLYFRSLLIQILKILRISRACRF